jgi:hypothetical protein
VQVKEKNSANVVSGFNKSNGAQELKLLKDLNKNNQNRCVVVGALPNETVLEEVVVYLKNNNVDYELVEKETELAPSYWVYIADTKDEELMVRLDNIGVETYLIASGDLKGQLSAGLFANIDLARDMVKLLRDADIKANLIEKKKIKKMQWVSFGLEKSPDGEGLIEGLKAIKINPGEIKEFFCKSIASEK